MSDLAFNEGRNNTRIPAVIVLLTYLISFASGDCSINKYPLWLLGSGNYAKYHSMDTNSAGNMVIGGSTKNLPFLNGDTISSDKDGFPFFEYFDASTCVFSWSVYLKRNLE